MSERESRELSRRDAVKLLGIGAALALFPKPAAGQPGVSSGAVVRTILRDVAPEHITGATLIHEHLSMGNPRNSPDRRFYQDLDLMSDEVKACATDGVSCIVDAGGTDLGRSIDDLRALATRSGMLIVASGGLHSKDGYPPETFQKTEEQIADDFYKLATAERWGAIGEMGTGTAIPMDLQERKVLRAAARLHVRTGLPIITHVSGGCAQCALEQVDLFDSAGANLNHVVIGHLNDIQDQPTAAPIAIAKRGAYVGFDHSGRPDDPRLPEYVRTIMAILEAGYGDRVCLSSDFASQKYLRKNGGPGISMVMTTMAPRLRQAGVDERTLNGILVENPRRALAFVPKAA